MTLKEMERHGYEAVRKLRKQKLESGVPFMIYANDLPTNSCYLEFADGSIKLARINKMQNDFEILESLPSQEVDRLREKYKLI